MFHEKSLSLFALVLLLAGCASTGNQAAPAGEPRRAPPRRSPA
ncbi:MAG: hypothetical protein ACLRNQ_13375 [Flavonifractor plautii]